MAKITNLDDFKKKKDDSDFDENKYFDNLRQSKEKRKKSKFLKDFKFIFLFTLILCLLLVMYRYSRVSNLNYEYYKQKNELQDLKKANRKLEIQLESKKNIRIIEQKAKEDLNMVYPKDENIYYIKVD
ncbi:MAG: septum formation initiator family protein [Peptostreptococcaceae bacterium]|jgi:cell division protein FtsL|nr:septum formation initiator family protein [Peptostreptococcaceae bacterium]